MSNFKKSAKNIFATLLVSTAVLGGGVVASQTGIVKVAEPVVAHALGGGSVETSSESVERLKDKVYNDISDNTYRTNTGDGVKGSKIYNQKGEITSQFDQLTESDKNKVVKDIDRAVQKAEDKDKEALESGDSVTNAVTHGTTSRFWNDLKADKNSVSGYLIAAVTNDLAPDYQAASDFLSPMFPFFNTGIGVFLILASFSFFFHLAVAIFYFMSPELQYFVGSDSKNGSGANSGGGGFKGFIGGIVPKQAIVANDEALNNGGNPIFKYIGKTWALMLAYAIILLFFAHNAMLTLVGPISNLFASWLTL